MGTNYVYQDGRRYDQMFHANVDLEFWLREAKQSGGAVLELACGTGRVAIPLAQAEIPVVGLDASAGMLAEAQAKAMAAGVNAEWVHADMRRFDLARKFSLVILANNALCHLLTFHDLEECLSRVRRHLRPEGRFIVDVFVPSLSILLQDPAKRSRFSTFPDSAGAGEVVVTTQNRYEPNTQINRIQTFAKHPEVAEELTGSFDMRIYFPQELDALLHYNGFRIDRKYGDFDAAPFGPQSGKQIIVCSLADAK